VNHRIEYSKQDLSSNSISGKKQIIPLLI